MEEQAVYSVPGQEDPDTLKLKLLLEGLKPEPEPREERTNRRIEQANELLLSFSDSERRKFFRAVQLWCGIKKDMPLSLFLYGVLNKVWPEINSVNVILEEEELMKDNTNPL